MQEQIDEVIKILLKAIDTNAPADVNLTIAEAISKLAGAKQTLFGIGEIKNFKNS